MERQPSLCESRSGATKHANGVILMWHGAVATSASRRDCDVNMPLFGNLYRVEQRAVEVEREPAGLSEHNLGLDQVWVLPNEEFDAIVTAVFFIRNPECTRR